MYLDMIRIGEKSDRKLLIFIMCLQKEKEKDTKLHCEKKEMKS